ncbi:hypothetical protein D1872_283910 [compost metagenome]
MIWALEPPKPKPFIPTLLKLPSFFQTLCSDMTEIGDFSQGICGLGSLKLRFAGIISFLNVSSTFIMLAIPAAASKCPMLDLTEPI